MLHIATEDSLTDVTLPLPGRPSNQFPQAMPHSKKKHPAEESFDQSDPGDRTYHPVWHENRDRSGLKDAEIEDSNPLVS
jgi:hypothetical protein